MKSLRSLKSNVRIQGWPPQTDRGLESSCAVPREEKTRYLQEHQRGLEVLAVPWGPASGQKTRRFPGIASPEASRVPPPCGQQPRQKTRSCSVGRGPAVAAPSHSPLPTQQSIFIHRHHLDRRAGLAFSWTAAMFTNV